MTHVKHGDMKITPDETAPGLARRKSSLNVSYTNNSISEITIILYCRTCIARRIFPLLYLSAVSDPVILIGYSGKPCKQGGWLPVRVATVRKARYSLPSRLKYPRSWFVRPGAKLRRHCCDYRRIPTCRESSCSCQLFCPLSHELRATVLLQGSATD